jgi:hypothetical protein
MARTTQQKRDLWGPPCRGVTERVALYGSAVVAVDPRIVEATRALNDVLARWGYKSRRADTGAYNCRKITDGKGYSLHAYGRPTCPVGWSTRSKRSAPPPARPGRRPAHPESAHYEIAASRTAAGIACTDPGLWSPTPDDAKQIRAIVREETTTVELTCEFLTAGPRRRQGHRRRPSEGHRSAVSCAPSRTGRCRGAQRRAVLRPVGAAGSMSSHTDPQLIV